MHCSILVCSQSRFAQVSVCRQINAQLGLSQACVFLSQIQPNNFQHIVWRRGRTDGAEQVAARPHDKQVSSVIVRGEFVHLRHPRLC